MMHRIKQTMIIALGTVLMLSSAGMTLAEEADYTGTWYLNNMIEDGVEISPSLFGLAMSMELNEDGSAQMSTSYDGEEPEVEDGSWSVIDNGFAISSVYEGEEDIQEFLLEDDGSVVYAVDGTEMIFGRELIEDTFEPGTPLTDTVLEDFNGTWTASTLVFSDMIIPYAAMGENATLDIADGNATFTSEITGYEVGSAESETTVVFTGEFADGILTLTSEEDEYGNTSTMILQIYDSGMLADITDAAGEEVLTEAETEDEVYDTSMITFFELD